MTTHIHKYPRTRHVRGSRLQDGDEDLKTMPFKELIGRHVVVEEKVDGANSGISYDENWNQHLQSRGHFLVGGGRERHFDLMKQWAATIADPLLEALEDRYVMFGEWLYAKHTVFYDRLPHYFMEFDILDTRTETYLSTDRRRDLLNGLEITPVLVLFEGVLDSFEQLTDLLGPSHFKSETMW
ncbi:MAG: RNA ligase family protein, partial [Verrucomicrobiota bacterium]